MFNKKSKKSPEPKEVGRHSVPSKKQRGRVRFFKIKLGLAIFLGLLSVSITAVTVWAFNITNSDVNFPNVYVGGVYVGGMTEAETLKALEEAGWQERADEDMLVKLPCDVSFPVDAVDSGVIFSLEDAAAYAHKYGHSSNVYGNLAKYLKSKSGPVDVSSLYGGIDKEYIRTQADKGIAEFMEKTADTGYETDIENGVIRLMKGAGQMQIDAEKLTEQIAASMVRGERLLEKTGPDNKLSIPDFQKIYDEVCVEAQDAAYTEKFEVIDEVVGLVFDIAQAQESWKAAKPCEYYEIALELIEPAVKGEELRSRLYRDRLGSQTTLFTYSSDNRISNIKLSASKFDGMILYPGEVFSFNDIVGKRTQEAGFLLAGAYSDGEVVEEIGGGICQVSSTLYCAAMYAQMKTMYRESHYFRVDYLPLAYDATVSWPNPDFRFRNDREYPVKIAAYTDDDAKCLVVEIWGTDTDGSYVELSYVESPLYDEEYTDVVIGTSARAYRNIYDKDGNFLRKQGEPYSTYHLHEDEIEWPEGVNPDPEEEDEEKSETEEEESQDNEYWGEKYFSDNTIIIS